MHFYIERGLDLCHIGVCFSGSIEHDESVTEMWKLLKSYNLPDSDLVCMGITTIKHLKRKIRQEDDRIGMKKMILKLVEKEFEEKDYAHDIDAHSEPQQRKLTTRRYPEIEVASTGPGLSKLQKNNHEKFCLFW